MNKTFLDLKHKRTFAPLTHVLVINILKRTSVFSQSNVCECLDFMRIGSKHVVVKEWMKTGT